MPQPYLTQLGHFTDFLFAYTHTLLYLRALYPPASFARARFHNTPVYQSRHPAVCEWLRDAIAAVHAELVAGTVARIGIVIYWCGSGSGENAGSPKILERFMLDVSGFPVLAKDDQNTDIGWDRDTPSDDELGEGRQDDAEEREQRVRSEEREEELGQRGEQDEASGALEPVADARADVSVDMSEQFRAALVMLSTRCSQLKPLPKNCSFNICMELKDGPDIDPPVGHPQPWIPVQPSVQKTGRKASQPNAVPEPGSTGDDLGGVKVTPIRTVEAGVLRFETWVEEGKAKYELAQVAESRLTGSTGE